MPTRRPWHWPRRRWSKAQNLVAALTGGTVPANATGTGLDALNAAKLAVQTAQQNLDNTKLYAPMTGTIIALNYVVGDNVGSSGSAAVMTIADLSQAELNIYMDALDFQQHQGRLHCQCHL